MLPTALVGGGQRRRLGQRGKGAHRGQPLRHDRPVAPAAATAPPRLPVRCSPARAACRRGARGRTPSKRLGRILDGRAERGRSTGPPALSRPSGTGTSDQHADHAQRVAAQRERILVAGRQLADAEQADQRLELVGQRHDHADAVARQGVAGEARLVVILDRFGHGVALAVVARVVAAHHALQLGELADHVGQQVGLGEQGGAVGIGGQVVVAEGAVGDRARDRAHALRALALRAELAVVDDLVEAGARAIRASSCGPGRRRTWRRPGAAARRARCLRSPRLGSAGAMLLTTRKRCVSLPCASSSGKYFWFAFIVRIRHSCGTSRNSVSNSADEHVRPLDQAGHFVEQRVVVDRLEAGLACRGRVELARDLGAAFGEAGDHGALVAQLRDVAVGVERSTIGDVAASKRWPCVTRPASRPKRTAPATMSSPCSATRPCAGRTKLTLVQPSASWYS